MNSNELFEKSLQYVPGGVHSPVRSFKGLHTTPRFIEKSKGAKIWDVEGNDYIDFCMSFGPLILGHQNPQVKEAVIHAMEKGWSFGACEPYSLELAEYLLERLPFVDQIRFVNSGTEAVMAAIRLARGSTKKNKIIKFNGCYHGHMDAMLIKAGSGLAGTSTASSAGITESTGQDTLVCELGDLNLVEDIFKNNIGEIAGVFIEPLPANNGLLPLENEYLEGLRALCDKYEALLIFDEVISGFRVDFGGMAAISGVRPDLITYGKIIGGGFPVGALTGRREIMEHLAPLGDVYQAGTLSANPIAMIAGLENVKQLTPEVYEDIEGFSKEIVQMFEKWFQEFGFQDYEMISYKSLFWPVPTASKIQRPDQIPENIGTRFKLLFEVLLNKGIYLSPNAYEVGFVSHAHNSELISELKKRLWSL